MKTRTKPKFTIAEFLKWLKTQPAKRKFNYYDIHRCACASFAKEYLQYRNATSGGCHVRIGAEMIKIPERIIKAVCAVDTEFTAGQLLKKLKGAKA